jgi:hypothetical protein
MICICHLHLYCTGFNFFGIAEVPTVFVESVTGPSLSYIPIRLGGESTDQDVLLGREPSESVYYIVTNVDSVGMPFDYSVSCISCFFK